jgi:apolipoprotein N-acyltransferase
MSADSEVKKKRTLKIETVDPRSFFEKIFDFTKNMTVKGRESRAFFSRWKFYSFLILLGALSALAFAPLYVFPLLWIVFPLFIFCLFQAKNKSEAFVFGLYFGFGQFLIGLHWLVFPFEIEADIPIVIGGILVIMLNWALAFFSAFACLMIWLLAGRTVKDTEDLSQRILSIIMIFMVVWNLTDYIRGHIFTGFPWNISGYFLGFSDIFLQTASVWGVYGLGVIAIFLALVPLWILASEQKIYPIIISVFVILGLGFFGMQRLNVEVQYFDDINLRIIQPNISQKTKWNIENRSEDFLRYLEMSRGLSEGQKNIVIWPETAVIYNLSESPHKRFQMGTLLNEGDVIMAGFPRILRWIEGNTQQVKAWNSMMVINHKGETIGLYDKKHLVPFGEYTPAPFAWILEFTGLADVFLQGISYSAGVGAAKVNLPNLPSAGVLICYEVIFSGKVIGERQSRPKWLLNITNDAWFGNFAGPSQHLLQTRVRAIEEGLAIVRSGGTGTSAVIDPYGRIISEIKLNTSGVMNSKLPMGTLRNFIYSVNNYWTLLLLCGIVASINNLLRIKKNAKKHLYGR